MIVIFIVKYLLIQTYRYYSTKLSTFQYQVGIFFVKIPTFLYLQKTPYINQYGACQF